MRGGCTGLAVLGQNCPSDLRSRKYKLGDLGVEVRENLSVSSNHLLIFFFPVPGTEETCNQNNFKSVKLYTLFLIKKESIIIIITIKYLLLPKHSTIFKISKINKNFIDSLELHCPLGSHWSYLVI